MKKLYIIALYLCFAHLCLAQSKVSGKITDSEGKPIVGALVRVVGQPSVYTLSNKEGVVAIDAKPGSVLEISWANTKVKRVTVKESQNDWVLGGDDQTISLGLTKQSQSSSANAISTVRSDELGKNSQFNVLNTLYGLLPGVTVTQNTGRNANPDIYVRGGATLSGNKAPLYVVDGFVRDVSTLNSADIESISVLKDASTALWGVRGANGVVVITTKRGIYNHKECSVDYQYGRSFNINTPEMVDASTYAKAYNEALINDGKNPIYTDAAFRYLADGSQPDLYPNVNWGNQVLRDYSENHWLNLNFRGGGERVRYYTNINYQKDLGVFNPQYTDYDKRFNGQLTYDYLNLRMNLDADLTRSTVVEFGINGLLSESKQPAVGGDGSVNTLIYNAYQLPALAFPVFTSKGIWGGNINYLSGTNPVARIATCGYNQYNSRKLQADLRLKQSLEAVTKGLNASVAVEWDNEATFNEASRKNYKYEMNTPVLDPTTGEVLSVNSARYGDESAMSFESSLSNQRMDAGLEGAINYDRNFDLHGLTGSLIYRQEGTIPVGRNAIRRYQSFIFTGGYSFANKYMVNLVANYSGASVLIKDHRFKWFPAISGAWVVSNEQFMKASFINALKVRASVGKSGLASNGYELDRQLWGSGASYYFGSANGAQGGISEGNLALTTLLPESSLKTNIGVDASILNNRLSFTLDLFSEQRKDILLSTGAFNSAVIGIVTPQMNSGKVKAHGVETALSYQDKVGDVNYSISGNFSFTRSEIVENNEGIVAEPYLSKKGNRLGQIYGLQAVGFFNSQQDIDNSPLQKFYPTRPGDIKYKDQNKDGKIDENDVIPIGFSNLMPEIYYGINLGLSYKGFGINALFQGVSNYSTLLNTNSLYWPLKNNTNISKWYMEDNVRWTEATKDRANLPRLTTIDNANNFRSSTLWLKDASYLKLRNLDVYYEFPTKVVKSLKLDGLKVYIRGNNLFSMDKGDYTNIESVGIGYPDQKHLFVGLNVKF